MNLSSQETKESYKVPPALPLLLASTAHQPAGNGCVDLILEQVKATKPLDFCDFVRCIERFREHKSNFCSGFKLGSNFHTYHRQQLPLHQYLPPIPPSAEKSGAGRRKSTAGALGGIKRKPRKANTSRSQVQGTQSSLGALGARWWLLPDAAAAWEDAPVRTRLSGSPASELQILESAPRLTQRETSSRTST